MIKHSILVTFGFVSLLSISNIKIDSSLFTGYTFTTDNAISDGDKSGSTITGTGNGGTGGGSGGKGGK